MSDKTTHEVLASLYSFVAHHEVKPNYPSEMKLIADTLDALQDQRDAMFRERCREIDAWFVKPAPMTDEQRAVSATLIRNVINSVTARPPAPVITINSDDDPGLQSYEYSGK